MCISLGTLVAIGFIALILGSREPETYEERQRRRQERYWRRGY